MEAAAASGETLDAASPSNLAVVVRSVAGRSRRAAPPAVSDTAVLDSSLLLGSRGPVVVFFRRMLASTEIPTKVVIYHAIFWAIIEQEVQIVSFEGDETQPV